MARNIDANDNEQLQLKPLSVAAERIVQRLENDKNEQGSHRDGEQPNPREKEQERAEDHRRYVEQRLRETLKWEKRISKKD
jgi:hypothetical protein